MRRSEFGQSRGLSFRTLDRHLNKRRWKTTTKTRSAPADGHFVPVELAIRKPPVEPRASCGLGVVLSSGRRIEVQRDFAVHTLERLVRVLERE
jgi:hypothetical protein